MHDYSEVLAIIATLGFVLPNLNDRQTSYRLRQTENREQLIKNEIANGETVDGARLKWGQNLVEISATTNKWSLVILTPLVWLSSVISFVYLINGESVLSKQFVSLLASPISIYMVFFTVGPWLGYVSSSAALQVQKGRPWIGRLFQCAALLIAVALCFVMSQTQPN